MTESEALAVSAVIEGILAFIIARTAGWPCRGAGHVGVASAVATGVTHPQLWTAVFWSAPRFGYWSSVVGLEVIVVLVEAGLIAWMAALTLRRSLLVSALANLSSATLGIILFG